MVQLAKKLDIDILLLQERNGNQEAGAFIPADPDASTSTNSNKQEQQLRLVVITNSRRNHCGAYQCAHTREMPELVSKDEIACQLRHEIADLEKYTSTVRGSGKRICRRGKAGQTQWLTAAELEELLGMANLHLQHN